MSAPPTISLELMWGPGVIGYAIASLLYGVTLGQSVFYIRAFPNDTRVVRGLVLVLFMLDSLHMYSLGGIYWSLLISCRRNTSRECVLYLPWQMLMGVLLGYWITFLVQCFYAHRVWIISAQNRIVTGAVLITALAQLVLGMMCINVIFHTPTPDVLFSTKFSPMSSLASCICDAIITVSVFVYLHPSRTGVIRHRRTNYVKSISVVFIEMGLLSFLVSLALVLLYFVQTGLIGQFLTAAPGGMLSKIYVNSALAVLNARKSIRDQRRANQTVSLTELPTLPTIR